MGERKTIPISLEVTQDKDHFTSNIYQSNLEVAEVLQDETDQTKGQYK